MRASDYDVDWWLKRSQSREYQRAYDTIAESLRPKSSDVVVEIGCGNGELLRRLRSGRLVGTDITQRMLRLARMNLRAHGSDSEIIERFADRRRASAILEKDKVLLVRDDYLESRIPDSFADIVLMSFPELEHESYIGMLSRELKDGSENAWLDRSEMLAEYREVDEGMDLRRLKGVIASSVVRDTGVHRMLKKKGTYLLADYASVDRPENMIDEQKALNEARDLGGKFEILDSAFVEERKIADDAGVGEAYIDQSFRLHGYSITAFRKR